MKTGASLKNRQGGAVAVMVGISMVMLIGFLALVIDLGHLYVAKTELQNSADAAALAGAKELNGKATGVQNAVNKSIAIAAQNKYDFSKSVDITIDNISVGNCPDPDKDPSDPPDCVWVAASGISDAVAANKYFIKVDTGSRSLNAWFAPIFTLVTGGDHSITSTFGMAVAGRTKVQITPLAICALQITDCPPSGTGNCGFIPGMAYNVRTINPIGSGTPYWIDPVATNKADCDGSTNNTVPFVCTGEITVPVAMGGTVYTNTGLSDPQVEALNSRFNLYAEKAKCDPATAPPDRNRREYLADDSSLFDKDPATSLAATCSATTNGCSWQSPIPYLPPYYPIENKPPPMQAAYNCTGTTGDIKCNYTNTLVWANNRPPSDPNFFVNPPAQGSAASGGWPPPNIVTSPQVYPATGTPSLSSGNPRYYDEVTDHAWVEGRRNMNLVIIQCLASGGECNAATVVGVGNYFMTTQAGRKIGNDSQPTIYLEYNRMLTQGEISGADIKLFR